MAAEAEHHNVPVKGKAGGLVFDEMVIQIVDAVVFLCSLKADLPFASK